MFKVQQSSLTWALCVGELHARGRSGTLDEVIGHIASVGETN